MRAVVRAVTGCTGKIKYASQAATDLIVDHRRGREHKRRAARLNAYECEACGFWHVGHSSWGVRA